MDSKTSHLKPVNKNPSVPMVKASKLSQAKPNSNNRPSKKNLLLKGNKKLVLIKQKLKTHHSKTIIVTPRLSPAEEDEFWYLDNMDW